MADQSEVQVFTKTDVKDIKGWKQYRKKRLTMAIRIDGSFQTMTREGPLVCPDGYLALDSENWPYPIAKEEFQTIYEEAEDA